LMCERMLVLVMLLHYFYIIWCTSLWLELGVG